MGLSLQKKKICAASDFFSPTLQQSDDEEGEESSLHTLYHLIKELLFSSVERQREYMRNYMLDSERSRESWEALASRVENYIEEIRKLLPLPQLVQVGLVESDYFLSFIFFFSLLEFHKPQR